MIMNYFLHSFAIGSIPFAAIVTFLFSRQKIHTLGDKNPGARNVYHHLGLLPGLLTLVLDAGKGIALMLLIQGAGFSFTYSLLFLLVGLIGHAFSPFLAFKGGQGVAMLIGAMLYLFPFPALLSMVVFAILRKWIKQFDLRYSLVLVFFTLLVFLYYPLLWSERAMIVGLFLFPLIKGYLFPKK
jgi:acyl phosphate:glycerol-3-phosphate acyltransferase